MDAVIDALDRLASRLAWTQGDAHAWWVRYREGQKRADAAIAAAASI
jgi:hypothetical protein